MNSGRNPIRLRLGIDVVEADPAVAVGHHVLHLAAPLAEPLHHRALVLLVHVDGQGFPGFANLAVDDPEDHFRARDGQFVAFAAHVLDQHRKVQFAPSRDLELVRRVGLLHAQRHIVDEFLIQPFAQIAAGHVLAFPPAERRIVDLKGHADGGFVDHQERQWLDRLRMAHGIGNLEPVDAGEGNDVARARLLHFDAFEAMEFEDLEDLAAPDPAAGFGDHHLRVLPHLAPLHAADADHAHVARVIERADLKLEGSVRIHVRRRHPVDDGLKKRRHVAAADRGVGGRPPLDGRCINHRKVHLLVAGAKPVKEIEGLIHHPLGPGGGAIHLVDHDDGTKSQLEGLAGHERGLRHGPLDRVHQQQHRVHHGQAALHLAAEVGVARRIDDVDAPVTPVDGRVLGQDGDAPFALQIIGVHDSLGRVAAGAKGSGLPQQFIHQGRLAVIDVRHDGDVSQRLNSLRHLCFGSRVKVRAYTGNRRMSATCIS